FLTRFEPQKKHFLCSKVLTPLKALQHKVYSVFEPPFCPMRRHSQHHQSAGREICRLKAQIGVSSRDEKVE
ncbi:MAG: hypothetical protein ACFN9G_12840, partial [Cardiobacterium sp.]